MTKLVDVVQMTFGFAFKSKDFTSDPSDVKLLRGDNVAQGRVRWDGAKRFPASLGSDFGAYELAEGDVVIAMDRPWISAGLKWSIIREADLPSLLVQRVARLRTKTLDLDQGFLAAVVGSKAFTDYVIGVQTGSAVPHISGGQIGDFEFRLPPIVEQRAIASTLGALDMKIASNERATQKIQELLDASSAMWTANLPHVPLRDLAIVAKAPVDPRNLGDNDVDHYSLPAFDDGQIPVCESAADIKSNKNRLVDPAVLISRLNPRFNRTWWVVPSPERPSLASTEFLALTALTEVELAALWLAVREPLFRDELPRRVTGTSGSHQRIRPNDLLSMGVPDTRQLDVSVKSEALALLRAAHQLRVESVGISELRDSLLPELLEGRLHASRAMEAVA